jgi:branched-chain amino acid aminotransferase
MGLAEKLGYVVTERNVTTNELFTADEVFLTGTAAEITPVREVNRRTIGDGRIGPTTKKLLAEFNKMVRDPRNGIKIR